MKLYQQGDVVFQQVEAFDDKNLKPTKSKTIQEGEVTGHSHVLESENATIYEDSNYNKFVRIMADAVLLHEEHKPINLPPGDYVIGIVREVDHLNNLTRKVID
jgi:hypothetical protein